jgi:LacI family transcriptional regulator
MTRATIADVARLAGVSIKTVSRVVNREPNVREATREKVEAAIAELNYRPNLSARNLASHRSHLIGLIYDDPSAYEIPSAGYVISLQQGVLQACGAADYGLLIHPCNYRHQHIGAELKALVEQARPDGIVLAAPLSNMPKIVDAIAATRTPFVKLSPGEENGRQYAVETNDREVCADMVDHLASLGHERIGFITGHTSHRAIEGRFLGYRDGLQRNGLTISEELVAHGDNSFSSGEACANKLLALASPPTAIFAANDDMAAGVIRSADKLRIDVPGQLSVAGFDDVSLARQVFPSLTTIRQPLSAMAEHACLALIRKLNDGAELHGTDVIPATLMIRESTGPAPRR